MFSATESEYPDERPNSRLLPPQLEPPSASGDRESYVAARIGQSIHHGDIICLILGNHMRRATSSIVLIIATLLLGVAAVSYLVGVFPAGSPLSRHIPETSATSIPTPTLTSPRSPHPSPTRLAQSRPKFTFAVVGVDGSGLSWTVSAQVANAGNSDAHHVWAKLQVFSGGSLVKVNGQDYLREDIGTLNRGTSVTRQVKLSVGALDALKISRNGATLALTLYSDEHTETFSYDYQP
ncbi:MAG: hypothetical protein ABIH46_01905 [Chloroflexota bacterium]